MTEIARSYAEPNRELVESFARYMQARAFSSVTVRLHKDTAMRFIETLGAVSAVEARRPDVHNFLAGLLKRGLSASTTNRHTNGLRCFFGFLCRAGLITRDPMLQVGRRKLPKRLPRVLTVEEVEALIAAAKNPFERAVPEVLYATGARVSELADLRLENIDFAEHIMLIQKGKGGKDRYVPFGRQAAKAILDYHAWRKPEVYLFEMRPRNGFIRISGRARSGKTWEGFLNVNGIQRYFRVGSIREFPTEKAARAQFDRIAANIPGFHAIPASPYSTRTIRVVLNRLAHRAGIGRVHPHSLRRAMACHMLAHGADIRAIQEILGHSSISSTQIYTTLTNEKVDEIYRRSHPHESVRGTDAEES